MMGPVHFTPILIFFLTFTKDVKSMAVESGENEESGGNSLFSLQTAVVSICVLCSLVLVVVGCTWAWWKRVLCFWRQQGTHEAPPDWFSPNAGLTTLDASTLQRDVRGRSSITIDPLPNIGDLGVEGQDSLELRTFRTPGIVPASDEAGIQAHDWFQEPCASFPRKDLEYQRIIGKGWFGKVLEAEASNIKQYVRTSNVICRALRDNATDQEQMRFLDEARMFRDGRNSEFILNLLGFCVDQMPYILIFEYFPLGDLKSYLRGKARQTPSNLMATQDGALVRMILDVIRGVKWMEQTGFVHGDLSARNCLVATTAGKVVIGDYGCSTQKFRDDYYWTSGYAIPIRWSAPETVEFTGSDIQPVQIHKTTHAANIWSLGVLIWEVFQLGKQPYDNLTNEDVIKRVLSQKSYILEPPQLPFLQETTKDKLYQLLVSCWNSLPTHRPTIETIEEVFTSP